MRKPAVSMRVVRGKEEVVSPQSPDYIGPGVLVHIKVDKALTVKVLTRLERELDLLILPQEFPVLIKPVKQPRQPAAVPLQKAHLQPGMSLQNAPNNKFRHPHQIAQRLAKGSNQQLGLMAQKYILSTGLVVSRRGMEAHWHPQLLDFRPQGVKVVVLHVVAIDRLRNHTQPHVPQLLHNPTRLCNRQVDVVECNKPCRFQPLGVLLAEVRNPAVPGLADSVGILGLLALVSMEWEGTEQHRHIDSLPVHRL